MKIKSIRVRATTRDYLLFRPVSDIEQDSSLSFLGRYMLDFIRANRNIPIRIIRAERYDVLVEGVNKQSYWFPWEVFK